MSLNKMSLIGHLGADPVVRYLPDGTPTVTVSIATSDTWKDKATGEKKERTEWHRVVFFSKLAEVVGEYLKKGSQVYVEAKARTRKWEKDGIDRYTTEFFVQTMQMLDKKPANGLPNAPQDDTPPNASMDDDIPQ